MYLILYIDYTHTLYHEELESQIKLILLPFNFDF